MSLRSTFNRLDEGASTVELFASLGVVVLPGPYGEKGTRVTDWPNMDVQAARAMTLRELGQCDINLVVRTGPELAAIDIDGKNEVDPAWALERLLRVLPEGVAVYRTFRGFGILFRPRRVLGDGLLSAFGAELFTAGHLVNIPPSRHPSGVDYEWMIPPGGQLPTVDLEALGLLPDAARSAVGNHQHANDRLAPASEEAQTEFQRLMSRVGIVPRRGGQELHHCPWHADPNASLSVNWQAAVFNDFAGCGQGGIVELRKLVGEPSPARRTRTTPPAASEGGGGNEVERSRLVRAMKESGFAWPFDRTSGRALWEDVLECHVALIKYECTTGHRMAYPKSCGFALCPTCVPTRLRADFRRHLDNLPASGYSALTHRKDSRSATRSAPGFAAGGARTVSRLASTASDCG